jgi:hypothetical protein
MDSGAVSPRVSRRTAGLLAAMLFAFLPAQATEGRPYVAVQFKILAPKFQHLPQRADVETALAQKIGAQIAPHFRFADWPGPTDDVSSQPKVGTLVVRLEEEKTDPSPRIVMKWYGQFGGGEPSELPIAPIEMYSPTDPTWATHDRADFETQAGGKLVPFIRTEGFYTQLLLQFVRHLPLATSIRVVPDDRVIVVPLRWQDVLLAPESSVVVRFVKRQGDAAQQGSLTLDLITRRARDPGIGFVQGAVQKALFDGHLLELESRWNSTLPELLNHAEVQCYLFDYVQADSESTSDGLVTDLP